MSPSSVSVISNNVITMTSNELEVLEHYKRKIVKYGEVPEVLLKCLKKLDQVMVNIELLQVTSLCYSLGSC